MSASNNDGDRRGDATILASSDPTATKTLRSRSTSTANRRWSQLRGDIRRAIAAPGGDLRRFASDDVVSSAQFQQWLNGRLDERVREPVSPRAVERGSHWTGPIVTEAYRAGLRRGDVFLRRRGYDTPDLSPEAALSADAYRREVAEERARLYSDVQTAADAVATDAARTYSDMAGAAAGAATGAGVAGRSSERAAYADIADSVNGRVDAVGQTRTATSIDTRVVESVNIAALRRYQDAGVEEVGYIVEADGGGGGGDPEQDGGERVIFATAGDSRVCSDCARLEGSLYSLSDVRRGDVETPPVHARCRCVIIPY